MIGLTAVGAGLAFTILLARGQEDGGTLQGKVVDREGAVLPAHILIHADLAGRNGDRPNDRLLTSGDKGELEVQLAPGFYDVCVMADGFVPVCRKIRIRTERSEVTRFRLEIDSKVLEDTGFRIVPP